jgi:FdrA protein
MAISALLKRNTYYDSITLMYVAQAVKDLPGVEDAGAVMATELNHELLRNSDLLPIAFIAEQATPPGPEDLLIVVRAIDEAHAEIALTAAEKHLTSSAARGAPAGAGADGPPAVSRSLEMALQRDETANLAVISVAGEHAWLEAEQALRHGLHVFLFSDNVPLAQEQRLKALAASKGLLLMGPDCGTAIINGIGLGFSNVVPRGPIGIVGASGTGMQQLICLIAAAGLGISQAIGTGGRDLSEAIGGVMMRSGLQLLANDPQTEVIVLLSKPPDKRIAHEMLAAVQLTKPLVIVFLGTAVPRRGEGGSVERGGPLWSPASAPAPHTGESSHVAREDPLWSPASALSGKTHLARTLTEGAELAVSLADGDPTRVPGKGVLLKYDLAAARAKLAPSQRYIRALYAGGTLCDEAMLLLSESVGAVASNIPLRPEWALAPGEMYRGHTALDLGSDEFTRGRPHPMIDPTLRLQYLARASQDPETAVILLDIVLGFCAHQNPAAVYAPAIIQARARASAAGRSLPVIISLCGTEGDPQRLSMQRTALEAAGALVFESNLAAALAAASFVDDVSPNITPQPLEADHD